MRGRGRVQATLVVVVGLLIVAPSACADRDGDASRSAFESRLVEREHFEPEQAACLTTYVFEGYEADAIEVIYDEGIGALDSLGWAEYFHSAIGCALHNELIGPDP